MNNIKINSESQVPVYEQIENHVKFFIASERLKPNDRLPSVLGLAKQIGVNLNTVAKAYRDLEVLGFIYTRRGMGCFVKEGVVERCKSHCQERIYTRLHEVVQEARASGIKHKKLASILRISASSDSGPYQGLSRDLQSLFEEA